ncbi:MULTISPECIES: host nuclease inhibitor protein [Pseudomonas aeruginosa group]|uniref:host nuclease inhibitor protein n=1 Tax=Pseudomonas aeruginosa group TaxID=136841 RepID=UPI001F3C2C12|nr:MULTISPECIES: host nuclease inhibitor protein [Pseudomonas aeruginosa group]
MTEETTISVDAVMEQAQVFASAWALVDGPFDSGNALENAEEAKAELREMLEDFFSNAELKRVAELLITWHQNKMGNIEQVLGMPKDAEIRLGEDNPIILTGEKLKGFRVGLMIAQEWFGSFPLQITRNEQAEEV